ncbi:MAG: hypothetical protein IH998_12400, partial [Proteobacteria bacterium]|nr:hypothetical protein [Pseudomonadota bacterium]
MIHISQASAVVAGAVLALLLIGAVWALYLGLRARAEAAAIADANARLSAL